MGGQGFRKIGKTSKGGVRDPAEGFNSGKRYLSGTDGTRNPCKDITQREGTS